MEEARVDGREGGSESASTASEATISDDEVNQRVPHSGKAVVYDGADLDLDLDLDFGRARKRRRKGENKDKEREKKAKRVPLRALLPGEVVWAKIPSFPWWPAQLATPGEEHKAIRHKKTDLFVVFFGDDNQCSWLPRDKLDHWMCEDFQERVSKRTKGLSEAVSIALEAIQEAGQASSDAQEPAESPTTAKEPEVENGSGSDAKKGLKITFKVSQMEAKGEGKREPSTTPAAL